MCLKVVTVEGSTNRAIVVLLRLIFHSVETDERFYFTIGIASIGPHELEGFPKGLNLVPLHSFEFEDTFENSFRQKIIQMQPM